MSANFTVPFNSKIFSVHFSPFDWCENLICVATSNCVFVATIKFDEDIHFETVDRFETRAECHAVVLSPETSFTLSPATISVCTAESDYRLHVYKHDPNGNSTDQELVGHKNLVNAISFDRNSSYLASTSDDHTVRVWSTETYECDTVFNLTSAGVALSWNQQEPFKLMVAEKMGLIRFYNVSLKQAISCFIDGSPNCSTYPLINATWAPNNVRLVATILQNGHLILWDVTRTSLPVNTKMIDSEFGDGHIKISSNTEFIAITDNLHKSIRVLVTNSLKTILVQNSNRFLFNDISWHVRVPVLCAVNDNKHRISHKDTMVFWHQYSCDGIWFKKLKIEFLKVNKVQQSESY